MANTSQLRPKLARATSAGAAEKPLGRPLIINSPSKTKMESNVLIAGAGPTALTLEIDLPRRGIEVRIVDKAAEFFVGSRGDGIQPRTLEVFDDLGIIDDVLTRGSLPPIIHAHRGGKFVGEL